MIAVNFTTARSRFKDFCDKVTDEDETVIVTRKAEKNVVIISAERYNELEKAARNAAFLGKLERGLAQVRAGQGIVKTRITSPFRLKPGQTIFTGRQRTKRR